MAYTGVHSGLADAVAGVTTAVSGAIMPSDSTVAVRRRNMVFILSAGTPFHVAELVNPVTWHWDVPRVFRSLLAMSKPRTSRTSVSVVRAFDPSTVYARY